VESLEPRQLLASAALLSLPDPGASDPPPVEDVAQSFYESVTHSPAESAAMAKAASAQAVSHGNVRASLRKGNLVLVGNNKPSSITITQVVDGTYSVTGMGTTTVNGKASPVVVKAKGIQVTMGAARDFVRVENVSVKGGLSIITGKGNDQVSIYNIEVLGRFSMTTGWGADVILGSKFDVYGSLVVSASSGNDVVSFDQFNVKRDYSVVTGGGKDIVSTLFGNIVQKAGIYLGSASDLVSVAHVNVGRNLVVSGGGGPDAMQLLGVTTDGMTTVAGGGRRDQISIQPMVNSFVTIGLYQARHLSTALRDYLLTRMFAVNAVFALDAAALKVDGGGGHDVVTVTDMTIGARLDVFLGDGWDVLTFSDNTYGKASLYGGADTGPGIDQLVIDQPKTARLKWYQFEQVVRSNI
jgi:hypothetical protein